MNSKAPRKEFEVDIDKAIDMFSNMSKCLDKKWNMHCELQCDRKCEECKIMYGFGNSGQIKNALENVQEWLEELKELKQEEYDNTQFQLMAYADGYNKAIDDFLSKAKEKKYHSHITYENCVSIAELDWLAKELKDGRENENI